MRDYIRGSPGGVRRVQLINSPLRQAHLPQQEPVEYSTGFRPRPVAFARPHRRSSWLVQGPPITLPCAGHSITGISPWQREQRSQIEFPGLRKRRPFSPAVTIRG